MTTTTNGAADVSMTDLVDVEILQRRVDSIVIEMGSAMVRTSGSPIISEARDFGAIIADADGEILAAPSFVVFYFGPFRQCIRHLLSVYPKDEIRPGDAFICNDPHTTGNGHAADIGIARPIFSDGELMAWCWADAHVYDVGGMVPGSFAPTATESYQEAYRFPGIKIVSEGRAVEDVFRLMRTNYRFAEFVLNDVRSYIAASNLCDERMQEVFERYGVDRFRQYCEISKDLSERAMRARIATLPDGTWHARDVVEGNGHDQRLYPIEATVTIAGERMSIDYTGTAPQAAGFINSSYGATVGLTLFPMLNTVTPDVPLNEGLLRCVDITAPEGTLVNPVEPAPTSSDWVTSIRAFRLLMSILGEIQAASTDDWVRRHTLSPGLEAWPLCVYSASNAEPFIDTHAGGGGMGAHHDLDGQDCGGFTGQLDGSLPDIEVNESISPLLYLWRRLNTNSGGPGASRGGLGVETAWTPWNASDGRLQTQIFAWIVPAPGLAGGYPGGLCEVSLFDGTDVKPFSEGRVPPASRDDLSAVPRAIGANEIDIPVKEGDVFVVSIGGGCGFGDPLDRDPELVAADVRARYLTEEIALSAYHVALDEVCRVDQARTADLREAERTRRLEAPREKTYQSARSESAERIIVHHGITRVDDQLVCSRCDAALSPAGDDVRAYLPTRVSPAYERLAELGEFAAPHDGIRLAERACPGCGTMLYVDVEISDDVVVSD